VFIETARRKVCLLDENLRGTAFVSKEDYVTTSYTWDFIPPVTRKPLNASRWMTQAGGVLRLPDPDRYGLGSKCSLRHFFRWFVKFNAGTSVPIQ